MKFLNAAWLKPRIVAAVFGSALTVVVGFWGLGWTTTGSAEQMAKTQSNAAVIAALVPLCVAKAEHDSDVARLASLRGKTTTFGRSEIVRDSGWATLPGEGRGPDYALAVACSDKLKSL